jgi:uncharacterized protein (TIGR02646 family)
MQRRELCGLPDATALALERNTARVLAQGARRAQYGVAKTLFSAKTPAYAFREIRKILASGAPSGICYYCERDRFRDIDHVLPQSVYPELAFDWGNYVYACAICNQDNKKHKCCVVLEDGEAVDTTSFAQNDNELPVGIPGLINPRREDPLAYLTLDLFTGVFLPRLHIPRLDEARARYTISTLKLNSDVLTRSRRGAFRFYLNSLERIADAVQADDVTQIAGLTEDINAFVHPSVLIEMISQAPQIGRINDLIVFAEPYLGLRL